MRYQKSGILSGTNELITYKVIQIILIPWCPILVSVYIDQQFLIFIQRLERYGTKKRPESLKNRQFCLLWHPAFYECIKIINTPNQIQ